MRFRSGPMAALGICLLMMVAFADHAENSVEEHSHGGPQNHSLAITASPTAANFHESHNGLPHHPYEEEHDLHIEECVSPYYLSMACAESNEKHDAKEYVFYQRHFQAEDLHYHTTDDVFTLQVSSVHDSHDHGIDGVWAVFESPKKSPIGMMNLAWAANNPTLQQLTPLWDSERHNSMLSGSEWYFGDVAATCRFDCGTATPTLQPTPLRDWVRYQPGEWGPCFVDQNSCRTHTDVVGQMTRSVFCVLEEEAAHWIDNQTVPRRYEWIRNNHFTHNETEIGQVVSYDECLALVDLHCPDADFANIDIFAYGGSGSGSGSGHHGSGPHGSGSGSGSGSGPHGSGHHGSGPYIGTCSCQYGSGTLEAEPDSCCVTTSLAEPEEPEDPLYREDFQWALINDTVCEEAGLEKPHEFKSCIEHCPFHVHDCEGEWTEWSECSACGGEDAVRSRYFNVSNPEWNGGFCVSDTHREWESCGITPCPYKWTESGWSECEVDWRRCFEGNEHDITLHGYQNQTVLCEGTDEFVAKLNISSELVSNDDVPYLRYIADEIWCSHVEKPSELRACSQLCPDVFPEQAPDMLTGVVQNLVFGLTGWLTKEDPFGRPPKNMPELFGNTRRRRYSINRNRNLRN